MKVIIASFRHEPMPCPGCQETIDAMQCFGHAKEPQVGSVSMCLDCGAVLKITSITIIAAGTSAKVSLCPMDKTEIARLNARDRREIRKMTKIVRRRKAAYN